MDADPDGVHFREQNERNERVDTDAKLENRVNVERIPGSLSYFAEYITAEGKPGKERRNDGTNGVYGNPENVDEHPDPQHFEGQPDSAGDKEQEKDYQRLHKTPYLLRRFFSLKRVDSIDFWEENASGSRAQNHIYRNRSIEYRLWRAYAQVTLESQT
jgi:hypothetical protein